MPLISQSKVFNFQLLCQLTRAQATDTWAPGQCASASRVSLDAERLAGNPLNSTWHETLEKLHLRRGERGEKAGERGRRRLREKRCDSAGAEREKSEREKETETQNTGA